jgi:transcriptional activator HAC1
VSIGSVPALDGFHFNNFSDTGFDYDGFLGAPQPSESDNAFFADGILPPADDFNLDYHHLADDNNLNFNDDFMLAEFLHHDENNQPSPEVQPADPFAESAAFLQPPIGASSSGCDAGGNAVAV